MKGDTKRQSDENEVISLLARVKKGGLQHLNSIQAAKKNGVGTVSAKLFNDYFPSSKTLNQPMEKKSAVAVAANQERQCRGDMEYTVVATNNTFFNLKMPTLSWGQTNIEDVTTLQQQYNSIQTVEKPKKNQVPNVTKSSSSPAIKGKDSNSSIAKRQYKKSTTTKIKTKTKASSLQQSTSRKTNKKKKGLTKIFTHFKHRKSMGASADYNSTSKISDVGKSNTSNLSSSLKYKASPTTLYQEYSNSTTSCETLQLDDDLDRSHSRLFDQQINVDKDQVNNKQQRKQQQPYFNITKTKSENIFKPNGTRNIYTVL